jgi:UDP-N-acetylglucosamine--N-acetylmuramyl-(pentapeptide) pyrophosphoryl-undecaprenol N-acetylglucosamine transferase
VPVLVHQQDARPGLANVLTAPFARVITVTFEKSLIDYGKKAVWIGNFLRPEFTQFSITPKEAEERLNLHDRLPVVLVLGGGTGALAINELIAGGLDELTKFCQIVHITGMSKGIDHARANYHVHEFVHIDGMIKAYAAADLVVSRCGMGVLTELSYLGKPSILIPMPESHQEDNALVFGREQAAVVLVQEDLTPARLALTIKKTLADKEMLERLSRNIKRVIKTGANEEIVKIIEHIIRNTKHET